MTLVAIVAVVAVGFLGYAFAGPLGAGLALAAVALVLTVGRWA